MASENAVRTCLERLAANYGRREEWAGKVLPDWQRALGRVDDRTLVRAVTELLATHDGYCPTLAKVVAACEEHAPRAGARTACRDCCDGIREFGIHRRIAGEVVIKVGVARCGCAAGEAVDREPPPGRQRIPDYAGQVRHLEQDHTVLAWWTRPSAWQRHNQETPWPARSSAAIENVRALVLGEDTDAQAAKRAALVRADEAREHEEAEWSA